MPNITVVFEPAQLVSGTASINEDSFRNILMPLISPMIAEEIQTTEKDQWIRWFRNSNWFANSMQDYVSNAINTSDMRNLVRDSITPNSVAGCMDLEGLARAVTDGYNFQQILADRMTRTLQGIDINVAIESEVEKQTTLMANHVVEKVLGILSEKLKSSLDI